MTEGQAGDELDHLLGVLEGPQAPRSWLGLQVRRHVVTEVDTALVEFVARWRGGNRAQSLAEANVPAGRRTLLHRHHRSEELYHITAGLGRITLGAECFAVQPSDTILIAPSTAHCVEATGEELVNPR